MDIFEIGRNLGLYFVPFLFALCFHEYAHGWVARRKGDRTAEIMGRLTLNPAAHVDLVGTILLPIMAIVTHIPFFGWAKPVPVDDRNFKNPKADMFWVALAGPLSNVILAVLAALALGVSLRMMPLENQGQAVKMLLVVFVQINLFLAFFNLIPLHPLDGGKVLARFVPEKWNRWLEANQLYLSFALIAVFLMGGLQYLARPVMAVAYSLYQISEMMAR